MSLFRIAVIVPTRHNPSPKHPHSYIIARLSISLTSGVTVTSFPAITFHLSYSNFPLAEFAKRERPPVAL